MPLVCRSNRIGLSLTFYIALKRREAYGGSGRLTTFAISPLATRKQASSYKYILTDKWCLWYYSQHIIPN